jgi:hypothetical protein
MADWKSDLLLPTKLQQIDTLQEGRGFDDGKMYTLSGYRRMAEVRFFVMALREHSHQAVA